MIHNDKVYIYLDRDRELTFRHSEIKRLQAAFAVEATELNTARLDAETTEKVMLVMLSRDAKEHGEDLKLSQMEDLLDLAKPGAILKAMTACLIAAYAPDDDPDAPKEESTDAENPTSPAV